jgi:hypothetical protein
MNYPIPERIPDFTIACRMAMTMKSKRELEPDVPPKYRTTPNPAVNRTTCKLTLQVPSGVRLLRTLSDI